MRVNEGASANMTQNVNTGKVRWIEDEEYGSEADAEHKSSAG